MTTDDSMSFIDSPIANRLGPIRALFLDEEQVGRLEKFRPYRMISEQMVEEVGQELDQRI
jgi:hypothetical protein